MDEFELKALNDIDTYGCHILYVLDDEDSNSPRFSYSIGINKCLGKPELIVTGLKHELAGNIINDYNERIRSGEVFEVDTLYSEFIGGFDVMFKKVDKSYYKQYFGWGLWLYKGDSFDVYQLIFPSTDGVWPWDTEATNDYLWFIPQLYKD